MRSDSRGVLNMNDISEDAISEYDFDGIEDLVQAMDKEDWVVYECKAKKIRGRLYLDLEIAENE